MATGRLARGGLFCVGTQYERQQFADKCGAGHEHEATAGSDCVQGHSGILILTIGNTPDSHLKE